MSKCRLSGEGWLALLGGGEFSFGETEEVDRAWHEHTPSGQIGFLPTASGSSDYGVHFAEYMAESFDREVVTLPIYRPRDARRGKNVERVKEVAAVYIGGGLNDRLLEVIAGTPLLTALEEKISSGGVVATIAAAAQVTGCVVRDLRGELVPGWGWLRGGVVEGNFTPDHDRRLRQLVKAPGVEWGWGIPSGSAVLLGGDRVESVGPVFELQDTDDDLELFPSEGSSKPAGSATEMKPDISRDSPVHPAEEE